uniref:Uncharacterized protein n=1 Tax=Mantoniella antarctica TaxID=81844 RepID=A0A7S0SHV6_9CHLO
MSIATCTGMCASTVSVTRGAGGGSQGTSAARLGQGGGRRAMVMGRRGGQAWRGGEGGRQIGLVVRAADEEQETEKEEPRMSPTRKRAPKPLPSRFGEGKVTGKKTLPFQDPFEAKTGGKPIASPFDMPVDVAASPFGAAALPTPPPAEAAAAAAAVAAKLAPAAASPFGAAAPPASPFGAAAPPASPFGAKAAAPAPPGGGSPFADTGAFGAAPKASGSPFAQSTSANPFGDTSASPVGKKAAAEKVDTRSAWEKLPKPATAQVVIVLSFTTIITLMVATFWVVVKLGAVSFNDAL